MKQQILLNDRLINYTLSRKKVKNINLRVKGGEVFVSAAKSVPLSVIEDFMQRKASWILSAVDENQAAPSPSPETYLCGTAVVLSPDVDRRQWQKEQAAQLLPLAFEKAWELFEQDGFPKPALRLRKMKSRWGSCIPSKGIITLNTALVGAESDCQIAVAAHELCHMLHPNHSKAFYAELCRHYPSYMHCQEKLKSAQRFLIDL